MDEVVAACHRPDGPVLDSALELLGAWLIRPLLDAGAEPEELIVCSNDVLAYLPFEALQLDGVTVADRFVTRSVPSATTVVRFSNVPRRIVGQRLGWSRVPAGKRTSTYRNPDYLASATAFAQPTVEAINAARPDDPGLQKRPYAGIQFVGIPEFADLGTAVSQQISSAIAGRTTVPAALRAAQARAPGRRHHVRVGPPCRLPPAGAHARDMDQRLDAGRELPSPRRSRAREAAAMLAARWPTWAALALAALTLADVGDGSEFTVILVVAAVGYLPVAVLGRPRATWPVVILVLVAVVAVRAAGVDEIAALVVLGAALAAVGLVGGSLRRPGPARLQVSAAVVFVGAGLLAVALPPGVGLYVVAAGLLGHAAWDCYHWLADRIVVRSFAEWCGVLDAVLGVGILVLV